eukprot:Sspe_Gene.101699::Locus_76332_Transcript_1_1_Confidence_1.000_Length_901::g.101699::m.101699/K05970/SIAE; sialate O-acetylesterase
MGGTMWHSGLVAVLMMLAAAEGLNFSVGFSSDMVLQRAPAKSAVYGIGGTGGVSVTLLRGGAVQSTVQATVFEDGSWKAYLEPVKGGMDEYSVRAAGKNGTAVLERVVFGDVFFCSGQSNMELSMHYTYSVKNVTKAVLDGAYSNIRFHQYGGQKSKYETTSPTWTTLDGYRTWYNASWAARQPDVDRHHLSPFHLFSATCMYFAIELTDQLQGSGREVVPIGLMQSAVGGTMIEAWVDSETLTRCKNESLSPGVSPPTQLYNGMVAPFVNTTVSGWLWYQGENN